MKYEQQKLLPTAKKPLGSSWNPGETEIGIIKESKKWNENLLLNIEPNLWRKQHDYEYNKEICRIDLPSTEVCRDSIVGPAARRIPTRDEIEYVASEGRNTFYDSAFEALHTLLRSGLMRSRGC